MPRKRAVKAPTTPRPRRGRPPKSPPREVSIAELIPWQPPSSEPIVSYVCPTCRTRRVMTPADVARLTSLKHVPLAELACSEDCRDQWLEQLIDAIQATHQEYVLQDRAWRWELQQGVVAERLGEVFQGVSHGR